MALLAGAWAGPAHFDRRAVCLRAGPGDLRSLWFDEAGTFWIAHEGLIRAVQKTLRWPGRAVRSDRGNRVAVLLRRACDLRPRSSVFPALRESRQALTF